MEIKVELGAFDDEVPGVEKSVCIDCKCLELERASLALKSKEETYKRDVKWNPARRQSEGNIVPLMIKTTKLYLGKAPCYV